MRWMKAKFNATCPLPLTPKGSTPVSFVWWYSLIKNCFTGFDPFRSFFFVALCVPPFFAVHSAGSHIPLFPVFFSLYWLNFIIHPFSLIGRCHRTASKPIVPSWYFPVVVWDGWGSRMTHSKAVPTNEGILGVIHLSIFLFIPSPLPSPVQVLQSISLIGSAIERGHRCSRRHKRDTPS